MKDCPLEHQFPGPRRDPRPPNPLFATVQAVIDQFGESPPTATRSRRHGHQPRARQHVENYLAHRVLGQTVRGIARATGKAPSTVSGSIRRGEVLVKAGSEARGFLAPGGVHLARDPDEPDGFSPSPPSPTSRPSLDPEAVATNSAPPAPQFA